MTTDQAFMSGFIQAKLECLRLLDKWLPPDNKDAKDCRHEMAKLYAPKMK